MSDSISLNRRAFEKGFTDTLTLKPLRDAASAFLKGERIDVKPTVTVQRRTATSKVSIVVSSRTQHGRKSA